MNDVNVSSSERVVALAGGVGGAKMAHGLVSVAGPANLSIVVNTADDFDLYGLRICPDLDTVMYTLAGIANPSTGWGIESDTRHTLDGLAAYGQDPWFLIGDRDFATHILRTEGLREGRRLTDVTARLVAALGVGVAILPMSDDRVATVIVTNDGELEFQEYFVRRRQQDEVTGVRFRDIDAARATPEVIAAIDAANCIVFCPSNPLVSLGPILEITGIRESLRGSSAVKIGISPIVAGKALKGPADRMLTSLGFESSALGVAKIYRDHLDAFVIDEVDWELAGSIQSLGMAVLVAKTVMHGQEDRTRLAQEVLEFAQSLAEDVAVP